MKFIKYCKCEKCREFSPCNCLDDSTYPHICIPCWEIMRDLQRTKNLYEKEKDEQQSLAWLREQAISNLCDRFDIRSKVIINIRCSFCNTTNELGQHHLELNETIDSISDSFFYEIAEEAANNGWTVFYNMMSGQKLVVCPICSTKK